VTTNCQATSTPVWQATTQLLQYTVGCETFRCVDWMALELNIKITSRQLAHVREPSRGHLRSQAQGLKGGRVRRQHAKVRLPAMDESSSEDGGSPGPEVKYFCACTPSSLPRAALEQQTGNTRRF